ncbi:MAG: RNA polymerase sigma factor, partial [Saprospiraceae bacterium]
MSKYRQDEELLSQLKAGNHLVWKRFFDEHLDAFLRFVMKYGAVSKDRAFEFYQDAIIVLHRKVTEGQLAAPLRSSLQTYLFGIGKNLCRRTASGRLSFPADVPDIPEHPMEEVHERQHNAAVVKSLLQRIGDKCREFLTLVFLDELPQDEIIEKLAIPSNEAFRKRKH